MVTCKARSSVQSVAHRYASHGLSAVARAVSVFYPVRQGIFALVDASVEAGTFYESEEEARFGRDAGGMPEAFTKPVRDFLARLPREAVVVEVGAGRGAFSDSHPGYVASDVSLRALARYCSGTRIQCDAMALPFRDESIDAFFSVAALEHVPDPERALNELDRCLKPGGRMLLYPAWYVRPWASRALAERRYRDLGIWDRVAKATIVVRDRRPYQALRVLPVLPTACRVCAGRTPHPSSI